MTEMGLRGRVNEALSALRSALTDVETTQKDSDQAGNARANLLAALHAVGRTGSITAILQAERAIVDNEFVRYASSDIRRRFLKDALVAIDGAIGAVERVYARNAHRDDTAHQFFVFYSAELAELANILDTDEQQGLAVRHSNIKIAENLYADHQTARLRKEQKRAYTTVLVLTLVFAAAVVVVGGYFLVTDFWTTILVLALGWFLVTICRMIFGK